MPPRFKFSREQIVTAGVELVRHKGWQALTTRALAEKLGTSARPIYSYFRRMDELERMIVQRAVELLHSFMMRNRTGDPWLDHGIGYVMFAQEEKHLFRSINDEKHIACFKEFGDVVWARLTASLSDHHLFKGLSAEQVYQIQLTRWLFAHGLAFQASNPPPETWNEESLVAVMRQGSMAIYEGLMQQFSSDTPK